MADRTGAQIIDEINRTNVPERSIALWWFGQSGFCIKGGGTTFYIDLYLAENPSRAYPPPLKPEEITNADYIICTHEHIDHYDAQTVPPAAKASPAAKIIMPKWVEQIAIGDGVPAERIVAIAEEGTQQFGDLRLTMIPSFHAPTMKHDTYGFHFDPQLGYRWLGFVMQLNGVTLYHSGDTLDYPGLDDKLKPHEIDIALLPINGRTFEREFQHDIAGNLNFRDAADLAVRAGARMVIPMHYDMFPGNYENPGYFADYIYYHHPKQALHIMTLTERLILMP